MARQPKGDTTIYGVAWADGTYEVIHQTEDYVTTFIDHIQQVLYAHETNDMDLLKAHMFKFEFQLEKMDAEDLSLAESALDVIGTMLPKDSKDYLEHVRRTVKRYQDRKSNYYGKIPWE